MTRKILCAFLALMLCFSMAVAASAESPEVDFVIDEFGYLVPEEAEQMNELARSIYENTGVGIFFVYTTEEKLSDYDIPGLTGGMENYFVMLENETSWYTFKGGLGETIDEDKEYELRNVYDAAETYVGGVEDFLRAAGDCFPQIQETPQLIAPKPEERLLYDEADLLTDSEEAALMGKLAAVSTGYEAQIVVVTIASMDGGYIDTYVDYVYDSMGFGYGENYDGVLLLVCLDPREYRILSNGFAGVAIDPDDISKISDEIVGDLSDGDYARAFDIFVAQTDYYLDGYLNGFPFAFGTNLMICLVIGLVVGLIVTAILKGQLKSVRQQKTANSYVKPGSMYLTMQNDFFLYRHVSRTRKESSSSSGSSGGGSSRSTGGGSF